MFMKVRNDVLRLESILDRKTASVDSLKRIISNREARIRELEARLNSLPATPVASVPSGVTSGFMTAYESARAQFERHDYSGAIASFENLLAEYAGHSMVDNCQYWIGECYFGLRQYQKAVIEFQKVFAYAATDKHDDAQLMIGLSYYRIGQREQAQSEFETFLNNYTDSEYTSIARRYVQNI
jgi:TolA-binding protein